MRALTIRQPWAWALAVGSKTIENRTQLWTYRGEIAVHAGALESPHGMADPRIHGAVADSITLDSYQHELTLWHARSAVLAVGQLVDVHRDIGDCCRPWGESSYPDDTTGRRGSDARWSLCHLVFEDMHPLTVPVQAKGALGLWWVDGPLEQLIRAQLTTPAAARPTSD